MKLKITFLGTGTSQGIPLIGCQCRVCKSTDPKDKRLRTSVMIDVSELGDEAGDRRFVIDAGPDFRQQLLREDVRTLDAIIMTHEHKDHLAGLDDVRAFNFLQRKAMPVYASERVQQAIRREYAYIFETPQYPGIPRIEMITIGKDPFIVEGIPFIPIEVMHHQMTVLGFRIGNFTYITDANFIPEEEKLKIIDTEILVLNALRKESHISHFTLDQAIGLSKELGVKQTYFTHISHQMGLHKIVEEELPEGINLAFDGLQLEL